MTKANKEAIEVLMGIVREMFNDEEQFEGFAKRFVAAANGRLVKRQPTTKPPKRNGE